MLVPNQVIAIKINSNNVKHYKELGYNIPTKNSDWKGKGIVVDMGKEIYVKIEDLPINSRIKVKVICDYCGEIHEKNYQDYNKSKNLLINLDCCNSCLQEKVKQTSMVKYGTENILRADEVIKTTKEKCLEKYGVEYYTQSSEYKERCKETCLIKYGVTHVLSSPEIRKMGEETCLKKYGVRNPALSKEFVIKANKTLLKNGNVPTSKQQILLHKMIQERYPNAILNYQFDRSIFDIALILDDKNIKIDIEYDGWVWHNLDKDRRRDQYSKSKGWKVLRVKSGHKLPREDELFEAIDYLINTEYRHKDIFLSDWKEPNKNISA